MAEPLSFTKAYEKWQLTLGISETPLLEQTVLARKSFDLAHQHLSYDKIFQSLYAIYKWDEIKNDRTIKDLMAFLTDFVVYRFSINEFLSTLFIEQISCLLRKEKYSYDPYPFLIFFTHRKEIIKDLGFITMDDRLREICFEVDVFERFLSKIQEEHRVVTVDSLDRGRHTPECRVLRKALRELSDEEIKRLHRKGDDTDNSKPPLGQKLQEWEPELNDRWSLNLPILLHKIADK